MNSTATKGRFPSSRIRWHEMRCHYMVPTTTVDHEEASPHTRGDNRDTCARAARSAGREAACVEQLPARGAAKSVHHDGVGGRRVGPALRPGRARGPPDGSQNDEESIFFFQAEDGIRDLIVTGVQTCALPI